MIKLPHQYPVLFVLGHEVLSEEEIIASYVVPADHPVLEGHFPHIKIWPGIHLIEGMNQTAGLHAMHMAAEKNIDVSNYVAMVTSVDKAKFRSPVFPNAELLYRAKLVKKRGNHVFYQCVTECKGEKVAEATVGLTAR